MSHADALLSQGKNPPVRGTGCAAGRPPREKLDEPRLVFRDRDGVDPGGREPGRVVEVDPGGRVKWGLGVNTSMK
jgi:hypothetical protein